MTPELTETLDWVEKNRPELHKPIKSEVERGNMTFITLLTIGWEAGWKARDKQPLLR